MCEHKNSTFGLLQRPEVMIISDENSQSNSLPSQKPLVPAMSPNFLRVAEGHRAVGNRFLPNSPCMKLSEIVCDTSFDLTSKPGEILNQIVKVLGKKQLTVPKCDNKILKSVSAYLGMKFKKHQVCKVRFVDLENTYLQAKMIPTEELLENQVTLNTYVQKNRKTLWLKMNILDKNTYLSIYILNYLHT